MKVVFKIISFASLGVCFVIPCLYFLNVISVLAYKVMFNIFSLFWFLSAPFWMIFRKSKDEVKL